MKVALVTGANTGIGLAIATRLLADGFALGYATADDTASSKGRSTSCDGEIAWVYGDLTRSRRFRNSLVAETVAKLGRIDVLVNNAGVVTPKPFLDLTVADFDLTFAVDVRASFLLAQAAANGRMTEHGGSIVNITSVHEHIPRPNFSDLRRREGRARHAHERARARARRATTSASTRSRPA